MDQAIEEFAKRLAATDDEKERTALISRAKLLAMNMAKPESFEPPITQLGPYLEKEIPVPPILVEPALVVRGGITCTVGRAGKGKTQVNLNRIIKWSCGRAMFPDIKTIDDKYVLKPTQPLKTLIIENEGAAGMFQKQLNTMVHAHGYLSDNERKEAKNNVLIWGDGGYSGLKLDDPNDLNNVRAGIEKWEPDVVFVEPFRGLWKGDENSSTDMAQVADALSGIASDYDCGVILTHHERKGGIGEDGEKMSAGRGSTVLEGVVATMENFEPAKGGDFREISWSKVRYNGGSPVLPIRMEWQFKDYWYRHVPLTEVEQAVLDALAANEEPMTIADLILETDESEHGLRKTMKALVAQGRVKKMPGTHFGGGSTGARYRLATGTSEDGAIDF